MAFGKLRKLWQKIKNGAKKVYHGFIKPIFKAFAPAIKQGAKTALNAVAPGSGFAAGGVIDGVVDTISGEGGGRAPITIKDIAWNR